MPPLVGLYGCITSYVEGSNFEGSSCRFTSSSSRVVCIYVTQHLSSWGIMHSVFWSSWAHTLGEMCGLEDNVAFIPRCIWYALIRSSSTAYSLLRRHLPSQYIGAVCDQPRTFISSAANSRTSTSSSSGRAP